MKQALRLRLARVSATAVSIALGIALAEAAARLFSLGPPLQAYHDFSSDALTGYRPHALSVATVTTDEFTYVRRHNSVGFRDVEHSIAKPPGVFRILALGDSFTYGTGVDFEQTYLYRLEEMLNSRSGVHPRVEIIKAGIPGFFPEPERIVMEHDGMPYAPDLVLVGFLPNDVIDTYRGFGALVADESGYLITREARELGRPAAWFIRHSDLMRLLLSRYFQYRIGRIDREKGDELYVPDGFHEADWQKIEAEYARMVAIATAGGARFALAHIPQNGPWKERHAYPATRLSSWSQQHGALFVDILPAMAAAAPTRALYYPRDGHCTAEGYQVIARTLFDALIAADVVPRP